MDIVLADDPTVSVLHAEMACVGGQWLIVDDGLSLNGTFLNGERVFGRRRLRDRDRLRLGRSELHFHLVRLQRQRSRSSDAVPLLPRGSAYRDLLLELARPLTVRPRGLPATDTEIAAALGASVREVQEAIAQLAIWYGLAGRGEMSIRHRLASIATATETTGRDASP